MRYPPLVLACLGANEGALRQHACVHVCAYVYEPAASVAGTNPAGMCALMPRLILMLMLTDTDANAVSMRARMRFSTGVSYVFITRCMPHARVPAVAAPAQAPPIFDDIAHERCRTVGPTQRQAQARFAGLRVVSVTNGSQASSQASCACLGDAL